MRTCLATLRDALFLASTCGLAPLWIAVHVIRVVTGVGPA